MKNYRFDESARYSLRTFRNTKTIVTAKPCLRRIKSHRAGEAICFRWGALINLTN